MWQSIKIGFYLAVRQLWRGNKWATILIICVMMFTFLNLVVVSGILVGLLEGTGETYRRDYYGDIVITPLTNKKHIEYSPEIINILQRFPEIKSFVPRYSASITVERNYQNARSQEDIERSSATVLGVKPSQEDETTFLSKQIVEGEYLADEDFDQILLGSYLIRRYLDYESTIFTQLLDAPIGSKVRVKIGDVTREMTVKGIINAKSEEVSMKVYINESQLRQILGRNSYEYDIISIVLHDGGNAEQLRDALLRTGIAKYARVRTFDESMPKMLEDMKTTFSTLGNFISSIGLVVAVITIFIVIFINALTRRKFIGIMKGIGVSGSVIEIAYIFQSFFYALIGSILGTSLLYGFLVPFMQEHPLDLPSMEGVLVAPWDSVLVKISLLIFVTILAGYIPARMIVRRNTLDAILMR